MATSTTNSIQQTRLAELHNNIVTSWLPLITPGPTSLPSGCASAFRLELLPGTTSNASITNIIAYDAWYGQAIDTSMRSCLPWEQTQWWAQERSTTVISLGPFACPVPYTTATKSALNAETTLVGCCPSDYVFQGTILPPMSGRQCLSPLASGQVITAKMGSLGNWTSTTATITETDLGVWGNQLNGYMFNDIPTTSSGPSSAVSTPALGTVSSISNIATGATSTPILSTTGGKIGIGIAAAVGVIGVFCLIVAVIISRKRAVRKEKEKEFQENASSLDSDFASHERSQQVDLQELSSTREHHEIADKEIGNIDDKGEETRKDAIEMWA